MEVRTYALFSNEYRVVPLVIKRNVCSFFEFEYKFFKDEVDKCSNCKFPSSCPLRKVIH